jgi:sec-independent protein translocase protein TatC
MGKINDSTQKKEMGFFDHVEALRWHIMRSAIAVVALSFIAFTQKKFIFDFLLFGPTRADFPTNRLFCWLDAQATYFQGLCIKDAKFIFINTDITGQFMLHIQMSLYVGAIAAFPYIFWEVWRFVKPALHEREIQKYQRYCFHHLFTFYDWLLVWLFCNCAFFFKLFNTISGDCYRTKYDRHQ